MPALIVCGFVRASKYVVNKRRVAPEPLQPSYDTMRVLLLLQRCNGLYRAVTVFKVINDQVSTVDNVVEMIVRQLNNRALSIKTELIDGGYHIIVSIKFSCCENVVRG